jgi:hypothetical protein
MRKRITGFMFIAIVMFGFIFAQNAISCSMFKITKHGKTMVGNNEDYWNPNTRIWFEKGKAGEYGAAYVGFDNFWPQGGMNQAGLVFDGFAMNFKAINNTEGKKELNINFLKIIMRQCATVGDVKKYFTQYDLSGLESSMFLFIDKSGKYLVVEGDSLITGNNEYYVLSNFYPSEIKNESEIDIPCYHKGKKLLDSRTDTSLSFCASVMDSMHQERDWGAGTMYTTIYDLNEGMIYLYFFRDYKHVVKFDLNNELKKNDFSLVIPELFPDNRKGSDFLNNYNKVNTEIELFNNEDILNDSVRYKNVTNTFFRNDFKLICTFSNKIYKIGKMWMAKTNYSAGINVFKVFLKTVPKSADAYNEIAAAFEKNGQIQMALENYKLAKELNPDDTYAQQQIERISKQVK